MSKTIDVVEHNERRVRAEMLRAVLDLGREIGAAETRALYETQRQNVRASKEQTDVDR